MNLAIYQGQPSKKSLNTVVSTAGIYKILAHFLELTLYFVGYGGFCQPLVGREGGKGSDAVLHRVQEAAVLHVHALRTRVSSQSIRIPGGSDGSASGISLATTETSSTNVPHERNRRSRHPLRHNAQVHLHSPTKRRSTRRSGTSTSDCSHNKPRWQSRTLSATPEADTSKASSSTASFRNS